MLAELTQLLHEVTDALRGRPAGPALDGGSREPRPTPPTGDPLPPGHECPVRGEASRVVLVTGTTSPGKGRLVTALDRALRPSGIVVTASGRDATSGRHALHVHAEADIDALLETNPGTEGAWARRADVIVPVDWEATSHSVRRIIDALIARGISVGAGV